MRTGKLDRGLWVISAAETCGTSELTEHSSLITWKGQELSGDAETLMTKASSHRTDSRQI